MPFSTVLLLVFQRSFTLSSSQNGTTGEDTLVAQLTPLIDRSTSLLKQAYDFLPLFVVAIVVVVLFSWMGRVLSRRETLLNRISPNTFLRELLSQAVRLVFTLLGLLIAMEILGATAVVGALLGTAGVVGIALGFAFRDTIENYIAGILLSIKRPFLPNEHIQIDGFEGKVIRLTSRATILMNFDGNHIRIPNANVFKSVMINFSRNPQRRLSFQIGLGNDVDLKSASNLARSTLQDMRSVLDEPAPGFRVLELGDSSVIVEMVAWVDQQAYDFGKVRSEAIRLIKRVFDEYEYDMPEPIYRLNVNAGKASDNLSSVVQNASNESDEGDRAEPTKSSSDLDEMSMDELKPDTHIDQQIVEEQRDFEQKRSAASELE